MEIVVLRPNGAEYWSVPTKARPAAKLKGVRFGRKRTIARNAVLSLRQEGKGATAIARELNIARSTVYKILEDERALSFFSSIICLSPLLK